MAIENLNHLKIGYVIAYDESRIDYQLMPQDFSRFVGKLVLMDDEACGAEEPSWLEVVELKHVNYDGSLEIWDGEETQTIPKNKLVKHSGSYVAFYAISEVAEVQEVAEVPESAVIVSPEYQKAVTLTRHIIAEAQAMQQSLYEVCKGLKEMRDGKLYKELGYRNFEDYCENEVGIKYSMAYKYAKIAEKFTPENLELTQGFGVEKLYLLSRLDETDREEVLQRVNPEETSTKQLQAQIKQLQAEKMEMVEHHTREQGDFLRKIDQLQGRVQELESHPADMHSAEDAEEIERLTEELDTVTEERDLKEKARLLLLHKWQESKENERALQKELDELKAKPPETVTVEDTSRIEELERKIEDLKQQLAEKPAVQESLSSDTGEFDAYLRMFEDTLKQMTRYLLRQNCTDFLRKQSISLMETKFENYVSVLKGEETQ